MASIRKRSWKTGSGEARVGWTVDYTDGQGHREQKLFKTRGDALTFRTEVEGQIKSGTFRSDAGRMTLKQVAELFLAHAKGRRDRGERMTSHTYELYEGYVWNYLSPDAEWQKKRRPGRRAPKAFSAGIGGVKLAQLTAGRVGAFRDRLRDAGVSVLTTRKIISVLKTILEYAIANDLVAVNVARHVTVIGRRDEGTHKIVPPDKEAIQRLVSAAGSFRPQLLFAAATGVRAGELHALRWKHLDLAKGAVTIETRVDRHRQEDVTKTKAGMRTVPLGAAVVTALEEWRRNGWRKRRRGRVKEILRRGESVFIDIPRKDDLVFPNRYGGYESHTNMIERRFDPLFGTLAALHAEDPDQHPAPPPRFNWHALRHFAISCWIEAGLAPKTVQTFAGHSSLSVTMDRYGHLFKSDNHRRAMDAIASDVFG